MYAGVKALIEDEGKLLTVKIDVEGEVFYALPGGRVDYGEAPLETLEREVRQKTGIEIEPIEPVGMYHFFMGQDNDGDQVVLTVWDVEWHGKVSVDSEHAEEDGIIGFEWVKPEDFSDLENVALELVNLIEECDI